MSCDCYQVKRITKTRKPHRCEYCGETIPKSSSAHSESGIFEGEAFRRYCCDRCWPFIYEFWDYVDGECAAPISEYFAEFLMYENPEAYREIFGEDDE